MSWLITIIVGAVVGWIVGLIMRSSWHTGVYTNILLGIVGAIVGVWFFAFNLGLGTADTSAGSFEGLSLVWQVIGSLVTLYLVNVVSYFESAANDQEGEMPAYSAGTAHEYRQRSRRRSE